MSWLDAVLLGILEGLTEFLPVSSTGHLILLAELLGRHDEAAKTLDIVIQLGAVLAVVVYYRQRLGTLIVGVLRRQPAELRLALALALGFLPAAVIGLALHKAIKAKLFGPLPVAAALVVGGVVMIAVELARAKRQAMERRRLAGAPPASRRPTDADAMDRRLPDAAADADAMERRRLAGGPQASRRPTDADAMERRLPDAAADADAMERRRLAGGPPASRRPRGAAAATGPGLHGLEHVTPRRALLIGLAQCLSLWPGASRSMSTIVGGQLTGLSTATAAEFSFLLAVPTLGAATLFDLAKNGRALLEAQGGAVALSVGLVVAFVVALAVIAAFLRYLRVFGMVPFGIYRILLGAAVLLVSVRGG